MRGYYQANKKRIQARQRVHLARPDNAKRRLEWLQSVHRPRYRERDRMLRKSRSPEQRRARYKWLRAWKERNPEKLVAYRQTYLSKKDSIRVANQKRRAKLNGSNGRVTIIDLERKFQNQGGCCYYCHESLGEGRRGKTIDHVQSLARGGNNAPENLVWACVRCNAQKREKSVKEFCDYRRLIGEPLYLGTSEVLLHDDVQAEHSSVPRVRAALIAAGFSREEAMP